MENILYIVVPCYNEEEALPETAKKLSGKIRDLVSSGKISEQSRILFVNDGSKDSTLKIMEALHQENKVFSYVNLSRNCGHQNALMAGLPPAKEIMPGLPRSLKISRIALPVMGAICFANKDSLNSINTLSLN